MLAWIRAVIWAVLTCSSNVSGFITEAEELACHLSALKVSSGEELQLDTSNTLLRLHAARRHTLQ